MSDIPDMPSDPTGDDLRPSDEVVALCLPIVVLSQHVKEEVVPLLMGERDGEPGELRTALRVARRLARQIDEAIEQVISDRGDGVW